MTSLAVTFLIMMLFKHYLIDVVIQYPYMYQNKGNYGHPGGLLHALFHGIGTYIAIIFLPGLGWSVALSLAMVDMVIHYHIDFFKTVIVEYFNWAERFTNGSLVIRNNYYFYALVMDQCLHFATYIYIAFIIFGAK